MPRSLAQFHPGLWNAGVIEQLRFVSSLARLDAIPHAVYW